MSPTTLFIRDPREIPFLHDQVKKALALADASSRSVTIEENDDFGLMTIQFLFKQIQHAESLLLLVPRRDAGLIARRSIANSGADQVLCWARRPSPSWKSGASAPRTASRIGAGFSPVDAQ